MPTFELTANDGKVYEIEAASAEDAVKAVEYAFGPKAEQTAEGFAPRSVREPTDERFRIASNQAEFEAMPAHRQAMTAADDVMRVGLDGLSYGFMDKLAGKIGGDEPQQRERTQAAKDRMGGLGIGVELAGSVVGAGKIAKAGEAALGAARAVPGVRRAVGAVDDAARAAAAAPGATGFGARVAGGSAFGAGLGGLHAAGHDQNIGQGMAGGAIGGAIGGVVAPAITKAVSKVAGAFNAKPRIMSTDELKAASQAAYRAADDAGVALKPQVLEEFRRDVMNDLARKGYRANLNPEVKEVLDEIDNLVQGNPSLMGIDIMRQIAGSAAGATNNKTRMLGKEIIRKLDDFMERLGPQHVHMGDKQAGVQALKEARKLWASMQKSKMIEDAIERAKNNSGSSGSGGNYDNALRQQFRAILNDPKKSRGLTPDERAAMQLIVRGVSGEKLVRAVSKMSPNGNGLMAALGFGATAFGGPVGLLMPAAGIAAKTATDRLTPARVEQLSQIVRAGGNASAARPAPNAVQRLSESVRHPLEAAIRAGLIVAPSQ